MRLDHTRFNRRRITTAAVACWGFAALTGCGPKPQTDPAAPAAHQHPTQPGQRNTRSVPLVQALRDLQSIPFSLSRPLVHHTTTRSLCYLESLGPIQRPAVTHPAIEALKSHGNQAVQAVEGLLDGPDATLHGAAIMALAELQPNAPQTWNRLERMLAHPTSGALRLYALNAWVRLEGIGVEPLTKALKTGPEAVQELAAFGLGLLGTASLSAVPDLLHVLQNSQTDPAGHNHLAASVAFALRRIGPDAWPQVLHLLRAARPATANYAASALEPLPGTQLNPELATQIRATLQVCNEDAQVALANALAGFRSTSSPNDSPLTPLLTSPSVRVRIAGGYAWAKSQSDPTPGLDVLASALNNPKTNLKTQSLEALGRLGGIAVSQLPQIAPLLLDEHAEVRSAAAHALGIVRGPATASLVLPVLNQALDDGDPNVANAAAIAIARYGREALRSLEPSLVHASASKRWWAAYAIGQLEGVPGAVSALTRAFPNQPVAVRQVMVSALARLAARPIDSHGRRGRSPARSAIPTLVNALTDEDAVVRREAASALGQMGPEARSTASSLLPLVRDGNASVRRSAIFALEDVGYQTTEILPGLMEILNDPTAPPFDRERASKMLLEADPDARSRTPPSPSPL